VAVTYPRGVTVTVLTPAKVADPYSGEATRLDWSNPTQRTLAGVGVGPRASSEPTEDGRFRVVTGMALYLDTTDVTVSPHERIVLTSPAQYAGSWQVDGEPEVYVHPMSGWTAGTVIPIKRAAG